MKKRRRSLLLLVGLFLTCACCSSPALGQDAHRAKQNEEVARLREVLDDPQLRDSEPERLAGAIRRAGDLKAQEAIGSLIRLLTFRYKSPREQEAEEVGIAIAVPQPYPAVSALFQIGEPALPALIRHIETNDTDPLARRNAAQALMSIFREEPRKGICYLRAAATKAPTPVAAQWLDEAAEYGKTFLIPAERDAVTCPVP